MQSVPSVPVGTTTLAGFATTLTGLVMAIIALTQGNATQDVVGAVIGGTLAVGSAIATLAGRYAQAHALAKKAAPVDSAAQVQAAVAGDESEGELANTTIIAEPFKGTVPKDKGNARAVRKTR